MLFSHLAVLFAAAAFAQATPAPTAYTVVQTGMMVGTLTTYRDGNLAVHEHAESHTRTYFDLAKGRDFSWITTDPGADCSPGTFSGDWGDPFAPGLALELAQLHPQQVATEAINGIQTKVMEATDPQSGEKVRMWIDAAYGEVVRWQGKGADGKVGTLSEIKSITFGKPPAAVFVMPASCAKLASQPLPPTEAATIAALTGSPEGTYVSATGSAAPGSKESCLVELSVVEPQTMKPIQSGFHVGVDTSVAAGNPQNPPHYVIGHDINNPNGPFFSGGGLRELTERMRNGVLKLGLPPAAFDVELAYDNGGSGGVMHRQCNGKPVAKLYYVVKNPAKLSEGGAWVWAK